MLPMITMNYQLGTIFRGQESHLESWETLERKGIAELVASHYEQNLSP